MLLRLGSLSRLLVADYRSRLRAALLAAVAAVILGSPERSLVAQVYNVDTAVGTGTGSLYWGIQQANAFGNGAAISFQNLPFAQVNLDDPLPDITVGLTISGNSTTLSGENLRRIFFVNAPAGQTVQFNGLTLANGLAQGGNGSSGGGAGGGGAGLGGAVFVNSGNVVFSAVAFQNNSAKGGNGGFGAQGGGGGGGGMGFGGGAGGSSANILGTLYALGGGGGGGARTSAGLSDSGVSAGKGGGVNGAIGGTDGGDFLAGGNAVGADGGGGGGGLDETSPASISAAGGQGGNASDFGGGGGGGSSYVNNAGSGGAGGFGGGGGGGGDVRNTSAGSGGNGGFGGGGGGGGGSSNVAALGPFVGGFGGFGGGVGANGNAGGGGGGAAFGAAVFLRSGATVAFTNSSTDAGSLTAGAGGGSGLAHPGAAGSAAGGAFFLMGGTTTFNVSPGGTQTIAGSIAQSATSSITVAGGGTLVLSSLSNGFSGGTTVNSATTLSVAGDGALGAAGGGVTLNGGSTLQVSGTAYNSTSRAITLGSGGGGINISNIANSLVVSHPIGGSGGLNYLGPGALVLGAANTFAGSATIASGRLVANYGFDGSAATFNTMSNITINNGGTLQLGNVGGANNVLGSGLNAPNVSIPAITINGNGILTTGFATAHNVGPLTLNSGATIGGDPSPPAPYGDYTFNSGVTANPASSDANITAPGGIDLRISIPFNVAAGAGKLNVSAVLRDEVGTTGGITMNGPGTMVLSAINTYSGATTVNNGILTTTATGTLGGGPLAVNGNSGAVAVLNLGKSQSVASLSGTNSGGGSARVNVGASTTLTINQSTGTMFAGTVALASGASAGRGGDLAKSNGGTLEIDGGLSLGNNSSLAVSAGKLRLNIVSGSASVGSGVMANISGGSVLELAGSVSALGTTISADRVGITNSSSAAAGLVISAGNQQVGGIDGSGKTQVNAGTSLTADHIVQSALVIGGAAGSAGVVTIDASDPSGHALGKPSGFALASSLTPSAPFVQGVNNSVNLSTTATDNPASTPISFGDSAQIGTVSSVPEPSSLVLAFFAILGALTTQLVLHHVRSQTV